MKKTSMCFRCHARGLIVINAKCSDLCYITRNGKSKWGYVPDDIGLGDDEDYVHFTYCPKCGQMQNAEFRP